MTRDDDWELENSPYSPAGEVEGFGRFAAGVNRRRRRGHRSRLGVVVVVAVLLVAVFVVPVVLGLVVSITG